MEITHFISSHDQIDADIQIVKDRNKKIHRIFLVVDILVTLFIMALYAILLYMYVECVEERDYDALASI